MNILSLSDARDKIYTDIYYNDFFYTRVFTHLPCHLDNISALANIFQHTREVSQGSCLTSSRDSFRKGSLPVSGLLFVVVESGAGI